MKSVKQWSKSIVIFHFLLVVSILTLFIIGGDEDLIVLHENVAYFVGLLILFRFYYSFNTKNDFEKISSWVHSKDEIIGFLKNIFSHKETKFHNPASSLIMIILVTLITLCIITGAIGLSGEEGSGYLSYLVSVDYSIGEKALDAHELITNLLLFFIIAHISGSIIGSVITKMNLIKSIFTFNKD